MFQTLKKFLLSLLFVVTSFAVNAQVNHLVISQAFGGGGNAGSPYLNDFVELFNPTGSSVSLTGWSIQYATATASVWAVTNLSGSIPAGGYYLVKCASTGATGAALPTPDATGTINLNNGAGGKLILISSTTAQSTNTPVGYVDFVAYGAADASETSPATAPPNSTVGVLRAGSGCTDADNNSTDFSTAAPSPRNSASAANYCYATKFVVSSISPVTPNAANTFSVTVQSMDAGNNLHAVTNNTTFNLTTNGNAGIIGGVLSGTITATSNSVTVSGVTLSTATVGPSLATITATRTSGDNLTAGTSGTFSVNPIPACSGTPTAGTAVAGTSSLCSTGSSLLSLTGGAVETGLTYEWWSSSTNTPPGVNIPGATNTTYTATGVSATTYYWCITRCSNSSLAATSVVAVVSVNPLPVIGAGANVAICSGQNTALTATGGVSYTWSPSSSLSASTGASVTATPVVTTTYTVTGLSAMGCPNTSTVTVSVNPLPSIAASAVSNPLCRSLSTSVNATGGSTYTWSPSTTLSASSGATVSATPTVTTTYTITGTDANSCVNTSTLTVTVNTNPGPITLATAIISTIAGTGVAGFSGNGTAATSAKFANPSGVALDASGNLYIADQGNNRVRMINTSGIITTIAGTGTAGVSGDGGAATAATLSSPQGVTLDASGNIYIADEFNSRIRKINTSGVISTIAGNNTIGFSGKGYAGDGGAATSAKLSIPTATAFDASGNLFIADFGNHRVRKVSTSGTITTIAGTGTAGYSGDGSAATAALLNEPVSVAFDDAGNLYIGNRTGNVIRKVNTSGIISTFAGTGTSGNTGDGGPATAAQTSWDYGLSFDVAGNLYLADAGYNRVRMVNPQGIISAVAGNSTGAFSGDGGAATAASLKGPAGTVLDANRNLYIADFNNNRIRKVVWPAPTSAICAGTSLALTNIVSGGTWSSSNPATGTISAAGVFSALAGGTTTISYILSGCSTTVVLTVNALPAISAGANVAICSGLNTSLSATGGVTYTWTPASGLSATSGASITATPTVTTVYTVTGTAANTCVNTSSVTVTVNPLPAISAGSGVAICTGLNTVLTATGGTSYSWSPATSLSATTGPTITASPASTITYTVTGTDANSCVNTSAVTVTVNPLPGVGAGSNVAICVGGNTPLTATGGVSYSWSPAIALTATTGSGVTASPTITTVYTVTGTDANTCVNTAVVTVTVNALPVISGGSSVAICNGNNTTLTAGGGATYTWSPATGLSASTGAVVSASPSVTTIYTVTGSDANSCTNSSSVTVTVNTLPSISAGSNVAICTGHNTALLATGGATYGWSPATGLSATTGAAITASPTVMTTYTVTGVDANGCINTSTVTVSVNPLPGIGAGSNVAICFGGNTSLTATGGLSYSWSPAIGLTASTGSGVVASPAITTVYTVTGTDANTCINTATVTVTVNSLPVVTSGSGVAICNGSSTPLTAGGGVTYTWSPSVGLSSSTGSAVFASPSATTVYTITGTDINSCINTANVAVTVNPLPSISAGSGVIICTGSNTLLTGTGGATYSWSPSVGLSSTIGASVTATPTVTTSYTVTGVDGNSCTNTAAVVVTVNPLPIISVASVSAICNGSSVVLTASGGTSYSWSPALGLSSSTGVSPTASPTTTATYTVTGTTLGCSSVANVTVTVNALPTVTLVSNGGAVCAGNTLSLISAASGGTGSLRYSWSGPNAFSSTIQNPIIASASALASGAYTVTATDANNCTSAGSSATTATVNPLPVVGAITGVSGLCVGNTTTMTDATAGGIWTAATAIATIGSVTGLVTAVSMGIETISYTVTSGPGCINFVTKTIFIQGITGNIYTTSGTGANTSTGDGGPAYLATMQAPRDLVCDTSGNVYFTDVNANIVRKIAANGIISRVAGNGTAGNTGDGGQATAATLNGPFGLYVDNAGNIFISNTNSSTIRKVNGSSGIITTVAGISGVGGATGDGGPATLAKLAFPLGLAGDAAGNIYISDQGNYKIRKIAANTGIITTIAGTGSNSYSGDGGPATAARLSTPKGVALDNSGNLYIADALNGVIRKVVLSSGIISTFAGTGGVLGFSGDGGPATLAKLNSPTRLAFDGGNLLYFTDQINNRVRQVNITTGIITTVVGSGTGAFGGDGGSSIVATISQPVGIACDFLGNLHISDASNRRIRMASPGGSISIRLTGPNTVAAGTPVSFTAKSFTTNNATYQWQKNSVNVGSGGNTYTNSSPVNGNVYRCILTIAPPCGSAFTDTSNSITVFVAGIPPADPLSTEITVSSGSLYVYPNPTNESMTIEATGLEDGEAKISLYDKMGKQVIAVDGHVLSHRMQETLDLHFLAPSIYYLVVSDPSGRVHTLKCIKN